MITPIPSCPISPLRTPPIDDMNIRHFSMPPPNRIASTFLRRPPDTATADNVRDAVRSSCG